MAREKPFLNALRMEIAAAGEDQKELRRIAKVFLGSCIDGEAWAIQLLAERLDGKVAQAIVGDDEEAAVRVHQVIEQIIVRPK